MGRRAPLAVVRAFTRGGIFNMLTLGFQETDLTSASPMQRIRFAQSGLSQGVDRPLWAQVSLWQLEETRCALVAIDHIGFGLEHAASTGQWKRRLLQLIRGYQPFWESSPCVAPSPCCLHEFPCPTGRVVPAVPCLLISFSRPSH